MTQTTNYRPMWSELGLDLDKHDALLDVLGQAYGEIYMSQKNRPEGMGYFDFVMSEVHGLRIKELTDGQGADVIFDPVGGDVFEVSLRATAAGRYVDRQNTP